MDTVAEHLKLDVMISIHSQRSYRPINDDCTCVAHAI